MAGQANLIAFDSRDQLAQSLADAIAERLAQGIALRGHASLAVSGGTTPARMFAALSATEIDWSKVFVTLIDERFVPRENPRSNARLVCDTLLIGSAATAGFVELYRPTATVEEAVPLSEMAIAALPMPLDVAVLGMGGDGHTASFFPDADDIVRLLENPAGRKILPVHAPAAGEPRLTLSRQVITSARWVVLHIEGAEKKAVLDAALAAGDKPIAEVISHCPAGADVYWAA